ncbi:MAG: carbohydrate-binding domain-containing protein [Clostridia bacterium]|nr:carbohydrate-binding domain-containing protein [Clostridia bacterium]
MRTWMHKGAALLLAAAMLLGLNAAAAQEETVIVLSDAGVTVDGVPAGEEGAVYVANDIIFYLEGQDFTYGEGEAQDGHSQAEADAHTVVHITKPGTYRLSGTLSAGQIAVDLGKEAKKDENAVVTLILDGMDVTCTVAPAVIFYNVYECGDSDADTASKDVDTGAAGANVIIADGTVNTVNGSYVARMYDPETVVLSEDGKKVEEAKKLHKYDGAFYSKRTMNVAGGEKGDGVLNINAENEGLDTELHLTINGGVINIVSGNDGINTNEDNVSVCAINGGELNITVTGATGEGDGIDSNGWLVITGGKVRAHGCSFSMDTGIDSDMGIHITGGDVLAGGNMLDHIAEGAQPYVVFQFDSRMKGGEMITLRNEEGAVVGEYAPVNDYTYLILSGGVIAEGAYTLWQGDVQYAGFESEMTGMRPPMMGGMPEFEMPDGFDPSRIPRGFDPSQMTPPQGMGMPKDFDPVKMGGFGGGPGGPGGPGGFGGPGGPGGFGGAQGEAVTLFAVGANGAVFSGVAPVQK